MKNWIVKYLKSLLLSYDISNILSNFIASIFKDKQIGGIFHGFDLRIPRFIGIKY